MPSAKFFTQMGMFVVPGFFDAGTCGNLRDEMRASTLTFATVLASNNEMHVDQNTRRTEIASVSPATRALVDSRLLDLKPSLQTHFGVQLTRWESPSFLTYKRGYHYVRHTDASGDSNAPAKLRERRVSISIFLNGEGKQEVPNTYSGGTLTFHGARSDPTSTASTGLALSGEEGLLIAFDAFLPHEVTPVLRGTRFGIVTWFS